MRNIKIELPKKIEKQHNLTIITVTPTVFQALRFLWVLVRYSVPQITSPPMYVTPGHRRPTCLDGGGCLSYVKFIVKVNCGRWTVRGGSNSAITIVHLNGMWSRVLEELTGIVKIA